MPEVIRVLLVEDNAADARLFQIMLMEDTRSVFQTTRVERLSEAMEYALEADIALLDLTLPDSQGLETFVTFHTGWPDLPVIVLTGLDDGEMALRAMREGAQDYLVKGPVDGQLLTRAIRYAIERQLKDRQLRQLNEALEQRVQERTQQLAAAVTQLESISRAKSAFLANMSHELRTPLSAILGFSELLLNEDQWTVPAANKQEFLGHIQESGQHLLSLINDILDISKVEAGRMDLRLESFSVEETIQQVVTTLRPLAQKKAITLSAALLHTGVIGADESKFKQVLYNLISNAIKFTPEEGSVTVTASQDERELRVDVMDTGIGVAPQDQERIFDLFQQIDSGGKGRPKGTGLGLALSKRFVEMHQGQLWVESELWKGSCFTFTIPLAAAPRAESSSPITGASA